jgi:hypothetical protein
MREERRHAFPLFFWVGSEVNLKTSIGLDEGGKSFDDNPWQALPKRSSVVEKHFVGADKGRS